MADTLVAKRTPPPIFQNDGNGCECQRRRKQGDSEGAGYRIRDGCGH